jgi:hypothetical protein
MKDKIRSKTTTKIDDETKKSLILEGKNKAVEEFRVCLQEPLVNKIY